MRCLWEQIGVLGPIYRLVSRGLNDSDIAGKLGVTELSVQSCVAWILHFLKLTRREELVLYAARVESQEHRNDRWGLGSQI
jgi:DNA-binding NarL/FixJ family response regulator